MGVAGGGHHTRRLVEQVVDETGLDTDRHTIDLDEVVIGVDPPAEHGDLAVHRDPTGGDQVFADPAATPAPDCQHLLQTFTLW